MRSSYRRGTQVRTWRCSSWGCHWHWGSCYGSCRRAHHCRAGRDYWRSCRRSPRGGCWGSGPRSTGGRGGARGASVAGGSTVAPLRRTSSEHESITTLAIARLLLAAVVAVWGCVIATKAGGGNRAGSRGSSGGRARGGARGATVAGGSTVTPLWRPSSEHESITTLAIARLLLACILAVRRCVIAIGGRGGNRAGSRGGNRGGSWGRAWGGGGARGAAVAGGSTVAPLWCTSSEHEGITTLAKACLLLARVLAVWGCVVTAGGRGGNRGGSRGGGGARGAAVAGGSTVTPLRGSSSKHEGITTLAKTRLQEHGPGCVHRSDSGRAGGKQSIA